MGNGLGNEESPIIPERLEAAADELESDHYGKRP